MNIVALGLDHCNFYWPVTGAKALADGAFDCFAK